MLSKSIIIMLSVLLGIVCGLLIFFLITKLQVPKESSDNYFFEKEKKKLPFENLLSEKYESIGIFLNRNGMNYYFGHTVSPYSYLIISVFTSIGFGIASFTFSYGKHYCFLLVIVFMLIGLKIPKFLIKQNNTLYNEQILNDIKRIFNDISVQIEAGVYITVSISECRFIVKSKRLRKALSDFDKTVTVTGDLELALSEFQQKFDNYYINIFCTAIGQQEKSGKSVDIINDLSEQMEEVSHQMALKENDKMSAKALLLELSILIFTAIMLVAIILTQAL